MTIPSRSRETQTQAKTALRCQKQLHTRAHHLTGELGSCLPASQRNSSLHGTGPPTLPGRYWDQRAAQERPAHGRPSVRRRLHQEEVQAHAGKRWWVGG